jgi:hypothetical protein
MEIKLKFFNPQTVDRNIKATVHQTGKLGFTIEAAKKIGLEVGMSMKIAINEGDESDTSLYAVLYPTIEEQSFKIYKAGKYFFLNLKPLLDTVKMDYKQNTYIYDISEETIESIKMLVFKRRTISKKEIKGENYVN